MLYKAELEHTHCLKLHNQNFKIDVIEGFRRVLRKVPKLSEDLRERLEHFQTLTTSFRIFSKSLV